MQHYLGEIRKDRVALMKSLIYARVGRGGALRGTLSKES